MVRRAILEDKISILSCLVIENVSVLRQDEGYTVKYSLSLREIPRAKPRGISQGLRLYFTVYFPTQVTIQIFSITIPVVSFLGEQYWKG